MNEAQCDAFVAQLIPAIEANLLGGAGLNWGGMTFTTVVKHVPGGEVNAIFYTDDVGRLGVEVTDLMLTGFVPDNAIKFSIAHELGHAFSEPLLARMRIQNAGPLPPGAIATDDADLERGAPTEVIADLGAAYVLNILGIAWPSIIEVGDKSLESGIFDLDWSGAHPPATQRAKCIRSFAELMQAGLPFELAAKAICLSMVGAGPAAANAVS